MLEKTAPSRSTINRCNTLAKILNNYAITEKENIHSIPDDMVVTGYPTFVREVEQVDMDVCIQAVTHLQPYTCICPMSMVDWTYITTVPVCENTTLTE